MRSVRAALAHLVWWGCVLVALGYAAAVALVGLDAPVDRPWVDAGFSLADAAGGGVLDREGLAAGWFDAGSPFLVALSSWGVASVAWLLLGGLLSGLVAPRRRRP